MRHCGPAFENNVLKTLFTRHVRASIIMGFHNGCNEGIKVIFNFVRISAFADHNIPSLSAQQYTGCVFYSNFLRVRT